MKQFAGCPGPGLAGVALKLEEHELCLTWLLHDAVITVTGAVYE